MTLFETLATNIQGQRRLLAQLYTWLLEETSVGSKQKKKWKRALNLSYSTTQWEQLNLVSQTFSISVNIRESRYKILHNWYLTPDRLSEMFQRWRCQQMNITAWHIWWHCPLILPFWHEIQRATLQITGIHLPLFSRFLFCLTLSIVGLGS